MDKISWKIIDKYFNENPNNLELKETNKFNNITNASRN